MKLLAVISSAAAIVTTPVLAMGPATTFDWSGFYAGVGVGMGSAAVHDESYPHADPGVKGFLGSVYGGYNFEVSPVVLGIEAELNASNETGSNASDFGYQRPFNIGTSGSIRGRVGLPFENALLYATAGVGFANVSDDHNGTGTNVVNKTLTGLVFGLGGEYAMTNQVTLRSQVLFNNYGTSPFGFGGGGDVHNINVTNTTLEVGVGFKF